MPGRYQTGSIAALVTATSPVSCTISPSTLSRPLRPRSSSSGSVSRALVIAMVGRMSTPSAISWRKSSATRWPHGSSETMRPGSDHCGNGPISTTGEVLVQVRPRDRIERAGRDRERAIERIGAAMRADGVAVDARIDGADHRPAFARGRRAPADRKAGRRACPARMGGEPDMGPIGCSSSSSSAAGAAPKAKNLPPTRAEREASALQI